ncbi:iron-sulfur cluster assembly protein [Compostibacter hankyongensis]|uniref:SUF system Fe-S cluster assembly protein n=1 Tax=Compostibacter hankyongensis TaxID=1007089 RepID=A0ABP8FKQ0_9BACT
MEEQTKNTAATGRSGDQIRDEAISLIQTCYDPEIPVNIWELGLIYEVNIGEHNSIQVVMTLTSPFCPAAQSLPEEVKTKLQGIYDAGEVTVDIVFDPPWTQDMMSEEAKLQLGFM